MIDYPVFIGLWLVVVVFIVLNRSKKVNGAENVLIDAGDEIYYRDIPITRIFKFRGKSLFKADVVAIEERVRRVVLVLNSEETIDLWLPQSTVAEVSAKAQFLVPNADYRKVD